jgi:hypothetical protein
LAIRIELWVEGRLVGGAVQWWDDIETSLPDEVDAALPLLNRVDPYGDVTFESPEMSALGAEARCFSAQAPERVWPFLEKLASLCDAARQWYATELPHPRCLL